MPPGASGAPVWKLRAAALVSVDYRYCIFSLEGMGL